MVAVFKRARKGGVAMTLGEGDEAWLRHVFAEMLELLGDDEGEDTEDDPLAAAVGIGTATRAPEDPALARLFPDGYTDDAEASADFRRYTEPGLRRQKREALRTAVQTLSPERVTLTPVQSDALLRALNDTRLVLGERLGVTEEWDELVADLKADDPRLALFYVYDRLTYLQEMLVQALWSGS